MPQVAVAVGAVDGDANAKADAGRSSKGADNGRMGGARGGNGPEGNGAEAGAGDPLSSFVSC